MNEPETWVERMDWRELVAVVLLSVTTILTAWSGFQSSKWSGEMSIAFSQASGERIKAVVVEDTANRRITVQVGLFSAWLQASSVDNQKLMDTLAARFPEPLATAFPAWLATDPFVNPNAPQSPFEMPEFRVPETDEALALNDKADALFEKALEDNRRGDNYTLLVVAFATVLFFAAISGRLKGRRYQWAVLIVGLVVFTIAAGILLSLPKDF
jgi:hypothetical protein